jgi:membrane protein implicated in regulation of membrane protease activity
MTTLQFSTDVWIAVAILSGILEVSIPKFAFVFSTLAALVAALASTLGCRWEVQGGAFVLSLLVGIFLLRPRVIHRLQSKKYVPSRTDVLIGKTALVIEEILPTGGRVELDGLCWAASSSQSIPVGEQVTIESADGIVLQVKI